MTSCCIKKRKTYVQLTEDHYAESWILQPGEEKFFSVDSEGIVIDEHSMDLVPNLSEKEYQMIVRKQLYAQKDGAYLVLIDGRLTTVSAEKLEIVHSEPSMIFEDDSDRDQFFDEYFSEVKKQAEKLQDDNASA